MAAELNHEANTFGQNLGYIEYNDTGHIINARAIDASIDISLATETSLGVVQIGDGINVDFAGVISLKPATSFSLGGVIVGADFEVDFAGTINLAQSGVTPGEYTKVTVNDKGIVTLGAYLSADDLTGGEIDIDMIPDHSIGAVKLTDYSTCYIQEGNPGPADYLGMFWFQPSTAQLRVYARGSAGDIWLLVGGGPLQAQNLRWGGTFNATTDSVTSVTSIGTSEGLLAGTPFPPATDALAGFYLLCETGGANCTQNNIVGVNFGPGDWAVCMGAAQGWNSLTLEQVLAAAAAAEHNDSTTCSTSLSAEHLDPSVFPQLWHLRSHKFSNTTQATGNGKTPTSWTAALFNCLN